MATEDKTPFRRALAEFSAACETAKRDDGKSFVSLRDGSPQWMTDAIHAAHNAIDGRLPNDWIYEACESVASTMDGYSADDADGMRENDHEICDGLVDVYNSARLAWLADHLGNADLCDEACRELGSPDADTFDRIGLGQFMAYTRIFNALIDAFTERADEIEEETDADEIEEETEADDTDTVCSHGIRASDCGLHE